MIQAEDKDAVAWLENAVGRPFKGALNNPFLAPRGVWLVQNKLMVSDTGQNRVFIWNKLPQSLHQEPDVVLGQGLTTDTERNAGGQASACSLMYPSGIWSDGQRLVVADAWNHRVLVWHSFPTQNGQPADVVIGQPDFASNLPNVKGVGARPSAQSLNWCYGVFSDGTHLWIADTGNRRVLYFDIIPTENFAKADAVIGKPTFEERDYENEDAIWPYSVNVSERGALAITDTQYYRVLLWHRAEDAFYKKADLIIGQPDFEANGQNQFGLFPKANTLNWCYDTCFQKEGLWVADTGNSRLLWWNTIPAENNTPADDLIGHADFTTGSENKETIRTTEKTLYWPFAVSIEKQTMVIADTGNHRIVIHQL
jgi:hypothetical protein